MIKNETPGIEPMLYYKKEYEEAKDLPTYSLDSVNWGDIRKEIGKYDIRNVTIKAEPPFNWKSGDISSSLSWEEFYKKLSPQEKRFHEDLIDASMFLSDPNYKRNITPAHYVYYFQGTEEEKLKDEKYQEGLKYLEDLK